MGLVRCSGGVDVCRRAECRCGTVRYRRGTHRPGAVTDLLAVERAGRGPDEHRLAVANGVLHAKASHGGAPR